MQWTCWRLPLEILLLYCLAELFLYKVMSSFFLSGNFTSSSSDALPSSSVITSNIADHDPPTEDEQPKKEEGAAHENGSSQSHDSLGTMEGKVRRKTRRRRTGQSSFTILLSLLMSLLAARRWTLPLQPRSLMIIFVLLIVTHSSDFGCHTSSFTIDHESVQSSVRLLLDHRLPKARQRTTCSHTRLCASWSPFWRLHDKRRRCDDSLVSGFLMSLFLPFMTSHLPDHLALLMNPTSPLRSTLLLLYLSTRTRTITVSLG